MLCYLLERSDKRWPSSSPFFNTLESTDVRICVLTATWGKKENAPILHIFHNRRLPVWGHKCVLCPKRSLSRASSGSRGGGIRGGLAAGRVLRGPMTKENLPLVPRVLTVGGPLQMPLGQGRTALPGAVSHVGWLPA